MEIECSVGGSVIPSAAVLPAEQYDVRQFRELMNDRESFVWAIKSLLREDGNVSASSNAIAREFCISPRTFSRRLQCYRLTYREILEELRKEMAREQLLLTQRPVFEIALRLGYSDSSNFVKAFRKWYGTTPRRYRCQYSDSAVKEP
ncbi:MAG: helix-turn-helix transcriptional regulator [Pseudomonadota bacterium]|nr:helix-turn-helix transcriptional regulator [Pseudomonadota bacterium]